jgi:FkbM family methyltransferase
MIRRALIAALSLVPKPVRRWAYRHPWVASLASRAIAGLFPSDREVVVVISEGPNRGKRLALDRGVPRLYWLRPTFDEEEVAKEVEARVKPGMVVADIGAFIGILTLLMSNRVQPGGRVLSFEPDPQNYGRLTRNIQINSLDNVEALPKAVTDKDGPLRFAAEAGVASHVVLGDTDGATSVEVDGITLDSLYNAGGLHRLDFAKIDVEDNEVRVLRGAVEVLRRFRPTLLIEIHSCESLRGSVQLLMDLGYDVTALGGAAPVMQMIRSVVKGEPISAEAFGRCHILGVHRGG